MSAELRVGTQDFGCDQEVFDVGPDDAESDNDLHRDLDRLLRLAREVVDDADEEIAGVVEGAVLLKSEHVSTVEAASRLLTERLIQMLERANQQIGANGLELLNEREAEAESHILCEVDARLSLIFLDLALVFQELVDVLEEALLVAGAL